MKQVKTFITYVEENNYVTNIYKTFKPAIITMVTYEVEK